CASVALALNSGSYYWGFDAFDFW
nr:immunoglobulin heavy chain junction region [Macaca mulatta]MOW20453.1 immunoglobulin heavy chain junction region [Macaca mulatta]